MKRIGRTVQFAPVYVITVLIRMNMIYQHDAASNFSHKFARKQISGKRPTCVHTGGLFIHII